jgi:hypothetical protein
LAPPPFAARSSVREVDATEKAKAGEAHLQTPETAPAAEEGRGISADAQRTHPSDVAEVGDLWPEAPERTTVGGLLFLLRVLQQIGLPDRLESDPALIELDLPERTLLRIATHLGGASDDPMLAMLQHKLHEQAPDSTDAVGALIASSRRWCRRQAHIGLRDLVVRPAWVVSTPTHVDVLFRLEDAEIRVRRAALDVNPGWVPWFGRVVTFHYIDGAELDRGGDGQ